jgi:CHASE2 domain-containing sensor protein
MGQSNRRKLRRRRKKARADEVKKPFLLRLLKATPVLLLATVLTFVLSQVGALQKLETTALDVQTRLLATAPDSEVAIVRITDDDYRDANLFKNKSPLDPTVLKKLIEAISRGGPRAIAVDIDTSAAQFAAMEVPQNDPPIVWGRTAVFSNKEENFYLLDVLGSQQQPSGLIILKLDPDGAVRRYQRIFSAKKIPFPSLAWQVLKRKPDPRIANLPEDAKERFIKFASYPNNTHPISLPASQVLSMADEEGWKTDGPLKDKIVLLGGDYAAQDEHNTPVGWMLGVEVWAHVIDTELRGGGHLPAGRIVIAVLQILDGLVLLILFQLYRMSRAVLISILSIPLLSLLCSLIAFWSLAQWAYFLPVLLAVLLQQVCDRLKDMRKRLALEGVQTVQGVQADKE